MEDYPLKAKSKMKVSVRMAVILGLTDILVMGVLYGIVSYNLEKVLRAKAVNDMAAIAQDTANLIDTYIYWCCDFVNGYSRMSEIRDVLDHDKDPALYAKAQEATDRYAEGYHDIEGLYVANWDTYVIAHTNPDSIDQTFRDEESALELQLRATEERTAYCTGIVKAPVTGVYVIPVYAAVYNDRGEATGFAGGAFYSEDLEIMLDSLNKKNLKGADFALIDAESGMTILSGDTGKAGSVCEDEKLLDAVSLVAGNMDPDGYYSYTDGGMVYSLHYMRNRNWVFVMMNTGEDVFGTLMVIRVSLIVICLILTAVMVGLCTYGVKMTMKPLDAINDEVVRLKANDYSTGHEIDKYCDRNNEFGTISNAIKELHGVLENQYELFVELFELQSTGMVVTTADNTKIKLINDMALDLYDIDRSRKNTVTIEEIRAGFDPDEVEGIDEQIGVTVKSENEIIFETTKTDRKDPSAPKKHLLTHSKAVHLSNGEDVIIYSVIDITDRKRLEENLKALSETDSLTDICNRRSGEKRIEKALEDGKTGMFMIFDVNKFKDVNDTYGHKTGDQVLAQIAGTMKKSFRTSDILIRLGGDEFAVFAVGTQDAGTGSMIVERLLGNIAAMNIGGMPENSVSVSLGAYFTGDKDSFNNMYQKADSVMYDCKKKGGNAYAFYNPACTGE